MYLSNSGSRRLLCQYHCRWQTPCLRKDGVGQRSPSPLWSERQPRVEHARRVSRSKSAVILQQERNVAIPFHATIAILTHSAFRCRARSHGWRAVEAWATADRDAGSHPDMPSPWSSGRQRTPLRIPPSLCSCYYTVLYRTVPKHSPVSILPCAARDTPAAHMQSR